jgi:CheY-like chemotaxis protein/HPt (histidine-containing phosphotransfer) domain-containing protein
MGDPYQIAIIDYMMPELDGEMLAHEIKADAELRDTVLIMLTSAGHRGDARRMKEAGFASYLIKPVRQSQLIAALAEAWGAGTPMDHTGPFHDRVRPRPHDESSELRRPLERKGRLRLLLVEDNTVNVKVALRMLANLGCLVDVAYNGKEAVTMAQSTSYDLIFMDCQMPEMDGYEATGEIRRRERLGERIPIVAMTAHAMPGDRERCIEAGMDDYISKPLRQADLQRAIGKLAKVEAAGPDPKENDHSELSNPFQASIARLFRVAGEQDVDFARDVIKDFLHSAAVIIMAARRAAESNDANSLKEEAHKLKGVSSNIGAVNMSRLCGELEQSAMAGSIAEAIELIDLLEQEFFHTREQLETQLMDISERAYGD